MHNLLRSPLYQGNTSVLSFPKHLILCWCFFQFLSLFSPCIANNLDANPTERYSLTSKNGCSVTFKNTGCYTASYYWDNNGRLTYYGTIEGGKSRSINTYSGHKWVFKVGSNTVGNYTVNCSSPSYSFNAGSSVNGKISGNLIICDDDKTKLTASGGKYYKWSTGSRKSSIEVASGTYTVTISDNSCSVVKTATVRMGTIEFTNVPTNIILTTASNCKKAYWTEPKATSNCGTPSLSSNYPSGYCFPIGTTTVIYTAKKDDIYRKVYFTVTIKKSNPCDSDTEKPKFANCPTNINLSTTGSSAAATWAVPSVSDNCTSNINPSVSTSPTIGLNRGSSFPIGTTTVTYTAKDAKGNTATCSFTVTVSKTNLCDSDTEKPKFANCPTNINLSTTGSSAAATWAVPSVSDNCTSNITPSVSTSPTTGLNRGSNFPIGTTTVTYTAKDAKGNTATCSFTVTVSKTNLCDSDTEKPKFANCPTNINLSTTGSSAATTWAVPSVSDNCTSNITPSVSTSPTTGLNRGSNFPVGTTTVTYTAEDDKGNTTTCSFTVTVKQEITPTPQLTGVFINEATGTASANNNLDFIEIYNSNSSSVTLDNVYLSDTKTKPFLYKFPQGTTLEARSFRLVNADGDLTTSTETTAAFGIGASGETIYLFQQIDGVLYTLDSLKIGATSFNTSYGRVPDGSNNIIQLFQATPSVSNNEAKSLIEITFSKPRGLYNSAFDLTLQAPAGATIRYTTDKTKPTTTNGTVYSGAITIDKSTVLRVFAYSSTGESRVITQTYVFSNSVSQELSLPLEDVDKALKELPIISISTTDTINAIEAKPCTFEFINKFGDTKSAFADADIRYFGTSSLEDPKKNLRVRFRARYGYNNFKHKIFERQPLETYNPTDEFDALDIKGGHDARYSTNLNEYLAHGLLRRMGSKDIHVTFVNVIMDGEYFGVCPVREKFDNDYAASYYDGTDEDFDYIQTEDVINNWPFVPDVYVDPGDGTLEQFQQVLQASVDRDYQALKSRLDVKHFVNSMLMFLAGNCEPEYKAIIGKNFAQPMVFFMQDADYYFDNDGQVPGYRFNLANNHRGPHELLALSGMGRTPVLEYKTLVRDQFELAYVSPKGVMTLDSVNTYYRRAQEIIRNSIPLEVARWNELSIGAWNERIDRFIADMPNRLTAVFNRFKEFDLVHTLKAVSFSKASGSASIGERILIDNPNPNTVVYYTLDGTDVVLDNNPSPSAQLYNATTGIVLPAGTINIRARAFATGNFGMYADARFVVSGVSALRNALNLTANGHQDGQVVKVDWVSNANKKADYYIIEKHNAITQNFDVIDRINAEYSDAINAIHHYNFTDNKPLKGDNIYRVGVVLDGQFVHYTDEFIVRYRTISENSIYPNPASEKVSVDLNSMEQNSVTIVITNMLGKIVARQHYDSAPKTAIFDVSGLRGGQYLIHIKAQGKRDIVEKVVIIGN